jgi:hypothetical protein
LDVLILRTTEEHLACPSATVRHNVANGRTSVQLANSDIGEERVKCLIQVLLKRLSLY